MLKSENSLSSKIVTFVKDSVTALHNLAKRATANRLIYTKYD